jgi:hypothetical protein
MKKITTPMNPFCNHSLIHRFISFDEEVNKEYVSEKERRLHGGFASLLN